MHPTRFRIRTLMVAVAAVGLVIAFGIALLADVDKYPEVAVTSVAVLFSAVLVGLVISPYAIFFIRLVKRCRAVFRRKR